MTEAHPPQSDDARWAVLAQRLRAGPREPWRMVVRNGMILIYRGRKCLDAMSAEDAIDEGSALLLLGESIVATTCPATSDPGLRP